MRLIVILAASTMLTAASCRHPRGANSNTDDFVLGAGMADGSSGHGFDGFAIGNGAAGQHGDAMNGAAAPEEVIDAMMENFQRVHFGYDSFTLDPESREALSTNAELMQSWGNLEVEIQGHSDNRGSTEYNLALGQRRAESVRNTMVAMGVAPDRVETISFGEELPLAQSGSEVAWAENRRAEFRVLSGDGQVQGTVD